MLFRSFLDDRVPSLSTTRPPLDYLHFVMTETAGPDQGTQGYCASPGAQSPNSRATSYPAPELSGSIMAALPACSAVVMALAW